jgi:hypothetical protein
MFNGVNAGILSESLQSLNVLDCSPSGHLTTLAIHEKSNPLRPASSERVLCECPDGYEATGAFFLSVQQREPS